jgi:hypothetical protein
MKTDCLTSSAACLPSNVSSSLFRVLKNDSAQAFPPGAAFPEKGGLPGKFLRGKGHGPGFFFVYAVQYGQKGLEVPFMMGPKKGLNEFFKHGFTVPYYDPVCKTDRHRAPARRHIDKNL